MAQPAKPTARKTTPATGRSRGRPPGSKTKKPATAPVAPVKAPRTAAAKSVATQRTAAAAAVPAPKVSKDELRAQVEKLERSVATLRARSRDAVRAAKQASGQDRGAGGPARGEGSRPPQPEAKASRAVTRTPKPARQG